MKITVLFIVLLFNCSMAQASDTWTKRQMVLQGMTSFSYIIDWGQTLDIVANPDEYYETNPILGKHPSKNDVHLYFTSLIASHLLITHLLPTKYREPWLSGTLMVSVGYINNNYSLGLRINF